MESFEGIYLVYEDLVLDVDGGKERPRRREAVLL